MVAIKEEISEGARRIWNIVSAAQHDRIEDALLADLVDILPVIGDFANAARIRDAVENAPERVVLTQAIDMIGGILPVAGDIFDIITPTNTINYFLRKKIKEVK